MLRKGCMHKHPFFFLYAFPFLRKCLILPKQFAEPIMSDLQNNWSERVIIVDCSFMDKLLADFTAHFSQAIGRPLSKADLCHWLDCLLLDAGIDGRGEQFVAFIHAKGAAAMEGMEPGRFADLNGQAFEDRLGEFVMQCYPVERITSASEFVDESLRAAMEAPGVKHILVVADMLDYGERLRESVRQRRKMLETRQQPAPEQRITFFTMHPTPPSALFGEAILGYSVMSALGIRGDEV